MADAKISSLTSLTSLSAADELAVASSGTSKNIRADHMHGFELDYVQITSNVTITSTSDGASGGTAIIDGNAVTYDGSTRICIEFYTDALLLTAAIAGHLVRINLYDGTTDLGRMAEAAGVVTGVSHRFPVLARRLLTPSAASHTYHIRGIKDASGDTASVLADAGGSTLRMPAYMRITVA